MHWSEGILPVLDFETTGVDTANDRIVEAALLFVEPDGGLHSYSYHALVNPGVPIPAEAAAVHGITDERVQAEGVAPKTALNEINDRLWDLEDAPLVIYNAGFDWPFFQAEYRRHFGADAPITARPYIIDPLVIDRAMDKYRRGSRKLIDIATHYGIDLGGAAHSADADGVAAAGVARALARKYDLVREASLRDLQEAQASWYNAWRDNYNEYRSRRGMEPISGEWPAA